MEVKVRTAGFWGYWGVLSGTRNTGGTVGYFLVLLGTKRYWVALRGNGGYTTTVYRYPPLYPAVLRGSGGYRVGGNKKYWGAVRYWGYWVDLGGTWWYWENCKEMGGTSGYCGYYGLLGVLQGIGGGGYCRVEYSRVLGGTVGY